MEESSWDLAPEEQQVQPENDKNSPNDGNQNGAEPPVTKTGSVVPAEGCSPIYCLTIIGQIEGHFVLDAATKTTKYEHIIPQLVKIEQDPKIRGLLVLLNTVGGDVEAGLALAELISGMKTPTVSLVLGGGHSIGVPLAVSADRCFIAESATMTIHPVRMNGLVLGVEKTLNNFAEIQGRITDFVIRNSHITAEKFAELMMNNDQLVLDIGTELTGKEAVNAGLIDAVGSLSDALAALNELMEQAERKAKRHRGKNGSPAQHSGK